MKVIAAVDISVTLLAIMTVGCIMNTQSTESNPSAGLSWSGSSLPESNGRGPSPPNVIIDTRYVAGQGRVIPVPSGASHDLQAALDAAAPGDSIELQPGRFVGNFTLPNKPGPPGSKSTEPSAWITVRTAGIDSRCPMDSRVSPSNGVSMAKLVTPNSEPVLKTAAGAHHFRLIGLELTVTSGSRVSNLVRLGEGNESEESQLPHDLIIDRCYIHGDSVTTARRGIALNCARSAIVDSYLSDFHEEGADSQAICGWNGPGPFKIVNNYLEGAGENVMFGGADPRIKDLVPSDIEFRRNHCAKPLKWKPGDSSYEGRKWSVKNLLELKNAQRVLIAGNVFENTWADAQTGYAVLFKSVNQDGGAPWCVTSDVDFTNNIVRHCGGGLNIQGRAVDQPGGRTSRIRIQNNLFDDVGGQMWGGDGAFIKISDTDSVTIDHNSALQTGNIIMAYGPPSTGFLFTNNLALHNEYGVKGDGTASGQDTLSKYFPGCVFRKNALLGSRGARYPGDNFVVTAPGRIAAEISSAGYRVVGASAYHNAGTDGRDVGCDFGALDAAVTASSEQTRLVR